VNIKRRAALIKLVVDITATTQTLTELMEEEEQYINNLPEGLTDTDQANAAQDAVDSMDTATDSLQAAIDAITEATGGGE